MYNNGVTRVMQSLRATTPPLYYRRPDNLMTKLSNNNNAANISNNNDDVNDNNSSNKRNNEYVYHNNNNNNSMYKNTTISDNMNNYNSNLTNEIQQRNAFTELPYNQSYTSNINKIKVNEYKLHKENTSMHNLESDYDFVQRNTEINDKNKIHLFDSNVGNEKKNINNNNNNNNNSGNNNISNISDNVYQSNQRTGNTINAKLQYDAPRVYSTPLQSDVPQSYHKQQQQQYNTFMHPFAASHLTHDTTSIIGSGSNNDNSNSKINNSTMVINNSNSANSNNNNKNNNKNNNITDYNEDDSNNNGTNQFRKGVQERIFTPRATLASVTSSFMPSKSNTSLINTSLPSTYSLSSANQFARTGLTTPQPETCTSEAQRNSLLPNYQHLYKRNTHDTRADQLSELDKESVALSTEEMHYKAALLEQQQIQRSQEEVQLKLSRGWAQLLEAEEQYYREPLPDLSEEMQQRIMVCTELEHYLEQLHEQLQDVKAQCESLQIVLTQKEALEMEVTQLTTQLRSLSSRQQVSRLNAEA